MPGATYSLIRDERSDLWPQALFLNVARHLQSQGVDVRCVSRNTFPTRMWRRFQREVVLGDSFAVLQDDSSGDYIVLDCHDWTVPDELVAYMRDPRCQRILKCQYRAPSRRRRRRLRPGPLRDIQGMRRDVVQPWTYFDLHWPSQQDRHMALRSVERTDSRMFFRGGLTRFDPHQLRFDSKERDMKNMRTPIFEALHSRGLTNDDPAWIPYEPYIEQMSTYRIALSLSGDGEFCHRDMEAFAIEVPLLRPRLRNQVHETLRENFHYVSVDIDPEKALPAEVAEAVADRYQTVVGMPDYLASIARNGAEWYDRNVSVPRALDLTVRLLGIELPRPSPTPLDAAGTLRQQPASAQ
jgi:hypothetical protein